MVTLRDDHALCRGLRLWTAAPETWVASPMAQWRVDGGARNLGSVPNGAQWRPNKHHRARQFYNNFHFVPVSCSSRIP